MVARLGERKTLVVALAFGALGFSVYAFASNDWLFLSAPPLIALWAMANPAFQGLATRLKGASEQIFAASIGARIFPGASYFLAAALLAVSLLVALAATRASQTALR